jgi:hypothetical protein
MNNTIINIRFGAWHLQVVRFGDWRGEISIGRSPVTFRRNDWHAKGSLERSDPEWRWFQIYEP